MSSGFEISTVTGKTFQATEIFLVPNSVETLAQVLADGVDLPDEQIMWLGSPAWVVSGLITDGIFRRARAKVESRRADDIASLVTLAQVHGEFVLEPQIQNLPTTDWRHLIGYGTPRSIMALIPDKSGGGFFGGGEGNFAGITRSRERMAKEMLLNSENEYIVSRWTPALKFKFFGEKFELPKDFIVAIVRCDFTTDDMIALRDERKKRDDDSSSV